MSSVRRTASTSSCKLPAHGTIDRGERLVEQQDRRFTRQRAGQRDALTLAARELARAPIRVPGQMDQLEQRLGARARRSARGRCPSAVITFPAAVRWGKSAYSWNT